MAETHGHLPRVFPFFNQMKIKIITIFIIAFAVSGCTYINEFTNANSNKSTVEKGVDSVQGEKKIGVKECDDLLDELEQSNKKEGESFVSEAARRVFVNELRDKIRRSIEENKKDPAKQAQECKQYQEQYDRWFKTQTSNKSA
jgi:hypothetical protein